MARTLDLWLEDNWNDATALRLRLRATEHSEVSPIQRIDVHDSYALGRVLCLNGRIAFTEADEALYAEGLAHPALQAHPAARRVLILGGGDGGLAREVCRYADVESVTVVEIDERVPAVVREYFPACAGGLDDPRVSVVHDDAHRFLATGDDRFDIILIDADELYDSSSDAVHASQFHHALARRLADDGVLIAPLGEPAIDAAACRAHLGRLQQTIATVTVYQVSGPTQAGHPWAVAWCSPHRQPSTRSDAEQLAEHLAYWSPHVQAGQFALPRRLRHTLGLS